MTATARLPAPAAAAPAAGASPNGAAATATTEATVPPTAAVEPTATEPFRVWLDRALRRVAPISPWALKLLSMSPDAEGSERALRELITSDPVLLGRVIGTANSPLYNPGGHELTQAAQAIQRLGTREVWRLAAVLALGASSRIRAPLRPAKRALWIHSFTVAHAARALAEASPRDDLDPDKVFVAALLHDIGLMVLLTIEPERCLAMLEHVADPVIGFSTALEIEVGLPPHARLGGEICRRWGLPADLVRLVGHHGLVHPLDHPPADRAHAAAIELGHQIAERIAEYPGLYRLPVRNDALLLRTWLRLGERQLDHVRAAVSDAGPRIAQIAESA
jgi:putative nucleotidyltransferase with HDIG domain